MRHHWLLLGACGWVLLILMFVTKYINFRATDGYGERVVSQNWTDSGTRTIRVQRPETKTKTKTSPRPVVQVSSAPSSTSQQWQSVIDQRNRLLSSVCKEQDLRNLTHNPVSKFVLDRIFVSDSHKILFCQTPKVGNTQWKKVLIVLNGAFPSVEEIPENIVHNHEKNGLPRLSSYSPLEVTHRLDSYFKFLIVRDPFERLISAFKDKFVLNPRFEPWYKLDIAPAIIRKYRRFHSDRGHQGPEEERGTGLRFDDYVRYLGDAEGRHRLDRQFGAHIIHWLSYVELCAPCDITYDVIGHHETLEQDAAHILRAAGIEGLVTYPHIPPGITMYNRTKVQSYFNSISKRDARKLYARYQGDFRLFGYQRPGFILD
ncbi:carbohydrate sulfotransferase 10 [Periophthalmus magnuspinnatus]|uniref:carbohydrate sulfotransferase 10 n=1 Tax=Periophthalmus magnuspinnatus TaxID=409849 RepID=UPI00145A27D9|nr:carbohydrate sulfotransferase 10 [Periophthalmus magnuspinnatus]XP_055083928.1 carbohydrate sulfotransferase 10 [Periophthalmus magnuspinnatus]XP_055083934.1 carbohydrate sulfotransferase 10 [Periophthalmus magnuspinnatus]